MVHLLVIAGLVVGSVSRKRRSQILTAVLAILALSAAVVAGMFLPAPNVPIFLVIFALALSALRREEVKSGRKELSKSSRFFGIPVLGFGLHYAHWVDLRVRWYALLYSPIESLNCTTLLLLSGL